MMSTLTRADGDYASLVQSRLAIRRERENENLEAEEKSLRRYSTEVLPVLRERLNLFLLMGMHRYIIACTRSYDWVIGSKDKFKPNTMLNWIFQSFFDREEPEFNDVIDIKVSDKSFCGDGFTVRDNIKSDITNIANTLRQIPDLEDYSSQELGFGVTHDLLSDFPNSQLSRSIKAFLLQNNYTFPSNSFVSVPGRHIQADLIMNVKYYPNRDDNRAYCMDINKLRSLCGACLHRLILPKSMYLRNKLSSATIIPAKGKNELNIVVRRVGGLVHHIVIIDISNFSGSAANAWLMLFCMALELVEGRGLKDKEKNVFCVDGVHFTAAWSTIIILYLYLTVGYPCVLSADGSVHRMPGGFLGVNGNITVALLFYSMFLTWMNRNRPSFINNMKIQAGGDDVVFILELHRKDIYKGVLWVEHKLKQYVGHVKETSERTLEDCDVGLVDGLVFCRKRVLLQHNGTDMIIKTEDAVPLSEHLTTNPIITNYSAQQEAWTTIDNELHLFETKNPELAAVTTGLRRLFLDRHPRVVPYRTTTFYVEYDGAINQVEYLWVTPDAMDVADLTSMLFVSDRVYYSTDVERVSYQLRRGKLEQIKVRFEGNFIKLVSTETEAKHIRKVFKRKETTIAMIPRNPEILRLLS